MLDMATMSMERAITIQTMKHDSNLKRVSLDV